MFDDTGLQMLFYMIVFFAFIPFGEFLEKKGQDVCKRFHSNYCCPVKVLQDKKNKAETLLQDSSLFCYFACCKKR